MYDNTRLRLHYVVAHLRSLTCRSIRNVDLKSAVTAACRLYYGSLFSAVLPNNLVLQCSQGITSLPCRDLSIDVLVGSTNLGVGGSSFTILFTAQDSGRTVSVVLHHNGFVTHSLHMNHRMILLDMTDRLTRCECDRMAMSHHLRKASSSFSWTECRVLCSS